MAELTPAGPRVSMRRPHLRHIPEHALPRGFGFRALSADDGDRWLAVWRDAEPWFEITEDHWRKAFGDDPAEIPRRCFVVEDEAGLAVATSSAWYTEIDGESWGRVHWVATRPAFAGRGIGRAMLARTLGLLAERHRRAMLDTQGKRLGAIKLYLDFGFLPDLQPDGARDAWRQIAAQLAHPALRSALG